MKIHDCIQVFSQLKHIYIEPLSECSKSDQGKIICNDNFTCYSLEKFNKNCLKLQCCAADALWFDNHLGVIITEFKSGKLDSDEKRRLRLQLFESIFIILPEIINKFGVNISLKDICDLKKVCIIVYDVDRYQDLKSQNIAKHIDVLSHFNLEHLKGKVYDTILPFEKEEFINRLETFRNQKLSPK
ncbi:MAG: hypothetical protein HPY74_18050 [Firmicutes bacterium]|nr:hypothetical protein [Bacillota bacterium]